MYDLPDSILAALRRHRYGLFVCLGLLAAGVIAAGCWLTWSGPQLRESLFARSQTAAAAPTTVYATETIAHTAWQQTVAAMSLAIVLALAGLIIQLILVLLGGKNLFLALVGIVYGLAAVAWSWFVFRMAQAIPEAGGLEAAQAAWRWWLLTAQGLAGAALTLMILAAAWRLLRAPPPGRDDLSTFVEL